MVRAIERGVRRSSDEVLKAVADALEVDPARLRNDHGGTERTRGDHETHDSAERSCSGTPPHARGPRGGCGRPSRGSGSTPARAGTTWRLSNSWGPAGEHPRTRGDHRVDATELVAAAGTPPHARGPPGGGRDHRRRSGNTPARAGTTSGHRVSWRRSGEHPRTRGDHDATDRMPSPTSGTPPHARGPRRRADGHGAAVGNTPARAGTTTRPWASRTECREHPRTRGDHPPPTLPSPCLWGTPPHARGPQSSRAACK
ncbi:Domain of uncharacterised function (DUF2825) [Streptomyces griseus]|nr:Domain of uncharacterised function (DUF2825) [Streptomyces griseus]